MDKLYNQGILLLFIIAIISFIGLLTVRYIAEPRIYPSICKHGYLFDKFSGRQIINERGGGIPCEMKKS